MLFHSDEFLFVFLPVAFVGWVALRRAGARQLALGWLLVSSLFFYAWWEPPMLLLLAASVAGNLVLGSWLLRPERPCRRGVLAAGITLNLAALAYFKYADFVVGVLNDGLGTSLPAFEVGLPLAISFFTFQQVAFLVDAYRGGIAGHSAVEYALFVTFFPQLIAGPIVHHREMLPQFQRKAPRRSDRDIAVGLTIFSIGLFKKVILADEIGAFVGPVFDAAETGGSISVAEAWAGTLAFTLQVYFDFSAYSDMAIGLARLFGFTLPLNFDSPYKATSISELWRRWHLTLSRFLRDYLFRPLGGFSRSPARRCFALMTTMTLCGLWHGAGWTFVVWGALHGVLLLLEQGWRRLRRGTARRRARPSSVRVAAQCVLTFLVFSVAAVLFRAESLAGAGHLLGALVGAQGGLLYDAALLKAHDLHLGKSLYWIAVGLAVVWGLPSTQQFMRRFRPVLDYRPAPPAHQGSRWAAARLEWRPHWSHALAFAVMFGIGVSALSKAREFIYFQF